MSSSERIKRCRVERDGREVGCGRAVLLVDHGVGLRIGAAAIVETSATAMTIQCPCGELLVWQRQAPPAA
jgi:hypothetical protein